MIVLCVGFAIGIVAAICSFVIEGKFSFAVILSFPISTRHRRLYPGSEGLQDRGRWVAASVLDILAYFFLTEVDK